MDSSVFRPSPAHHPVWVGLRTLLYAILIWCLTLWVFPSVIVRIEYALTIQQLSFPFQQPTAWVLFVAAAAFNLASAITMAVFGRGTPLPMDCAPRLVIQGPYRCVRNPMAIGGLGMGFAVAIGLGSFGVLIYVIAGMVFWNFVVRPIEERDLHKRFGPPYENYRDQVKCWVPTFSFHPETQDESSSG